MTASPQSAQSTRNCVGAVVVEAETVDQRILFEETKDSRLRITRLRRCSDRADLDKTKSKSRPCRQRDAVFVESSSQADRIREIQAEKSFRRFRGLKGFQRAKRKIDMGGYPQAFDGESVGSLGID